MKNMTRCFHHPRAINHPWNARAFDAPIARETHDRPCPSISRQSRSRRAYALIRSAVSAANLSINPPVSATKQTSRYEAVPSRDFGALGSSHGKTCGERGDLVGHATRPPLPNIGGRRAFVCYAIRVNSVAKVRSRAMNHAHAIRAFRRRRVSRIRRCGWPGGQLIDSDSGIRAKRILGSYWLLTVRRMEEPESANTASSSRQNVEALAMPAVAWWHDDPQNVSLSTPVNADAVRELTPTSPTRSRDAWEHAASREASGKPAPSWQRGESSETVNRRLLDRYGESVHRSIETPEISKFKGKLSVLPDTIIFRMH